MYTYDTQFTVAPTISTDPQSQMVRYIYINRVSQLYHRLSLQGRIARLLDKVFNRESSLLDLNIYRERLRLRGQHYAGIQAVNIDQIRGTHGKGSDFDARFAPLNERTRSRWLGIAFARQHGTPLPPVELILVGETYFVVDGHHRISVAKALGEQSVDAEITLWNVSGPLPWENNTAPATLSCQPA